MGTVPTASSTGLYVAEQEGLFRQAGLHVKIVNAASGDAATAALLSGAIDVLNGAYVGFIAAQAHGAGTFHVLADGYAGAPDVDKVVVARGSPITTVQQLRGKTIAVNALGSVAQLLVDSALTAHVVPPSQVRFVVIPFPAMPAALRRHQVDAAYLPEPYLSQAEAATGAVALFDTNQGATQAFPISGYVATLAWWRRYPHTAAAFASALRRGQAVAATSHAAVEKALAAYTRISRPTLAVMAVGTFPTSVDTSRLQRVADVMRQFGLLTHPFSVGVMTQAGTR